MLNRSFPGRPKVPSPLKNIRRSPVTARKRLAGRTVAATIPAVATPTTAAVRNCRFTETEPTVVKAPISTTSPGRRCDAAALARLDVCLLLMWSFWGNSWGWEKDPLKFYRSSGDTVRISRGIRGPVASELLEVQLAHQRHARPARLPEGSAGAAVVAGNRALQARGRRSRTTVPEKKPGDPACLTRQSDR